MPDLRIACTCGELVLVASSVAPVEASRIACSCRGCQAFARRMARPEILDADGFTERINLSPATLTITAGREHLACVQQTRRGAYRWYARCCHTPMVLTLSSARVPFVGIDAARVDSGDLPAGLAGAVGPVRARVNSRFRGAEARARKADLRSLLSMLRHLMPLTLRWWWRNDHKRSPFFESGKPVVAVEALGLKKLPAPD